MILQDIDNGAGSVQLIAFEVSGGTSNKGKVNITRIDKGLIQVKHVDQVIQVKQAMLVKEVNKFR